MNEHRYNELFDRARMRVTDLGRAERTLERELLMETPGYPRIVRVRWTPQCRWDRDALCDFLRLVRWEYERLQGDPYRRRDIFPLCLMHQGFCPICHG